MFEVIPKDDGNPSGGSVVTDDLSGRLTFGVEIEFLCPVVPQDTHDPHAYRDHRRVAHDFAGRGEGEYIFEALQKWAPSVEVRPWHMWHDGITFDRWFFRPEESARLGRSEPLGALYKTDGCELSSEVLWAGDAINKVKIRDVCAAIRSERVLLNDTTSVHVHVGRGKLGFSLLTIKKLTSLLWIVDDALMSLQHPSREESKYCQKITKYSNLAVESSQEPLPLNLSEEGILQMAEYLPRVCRDAYQIELTRIWGAKTIEELQKLVQLHTCDCTIRGSVSYQKLASNKTNTVEFRQMGGSLEPDVIMHWTEICVALMQFARTSDAPKFQALTGRLMGMKPLSCAVELISKLGLAEAISDYYLSKYETYHIERDLTYFEGQERGHFVPTLPDSS